MINDVTQRGMSVEAVIPVFNGQETIALAIESALRQTSPFSRITVVDQCSSDNTAAITKRYSQVRYVMNAESRNPSDNWNKAVSLVESDFVCVLHADDILLPQWNEQCLLLLGKAPDPLATCLFVGGAEFRFPHELTSILLFADQPRLYGKGGLLKVLWARGFYGLRASANVLYSRRVFERFGGFPAGVFASMGDVPLHLRMLAEIPFGYVPSPLLLMRVGEKGRLSLSRRDELARGAFLALENSADKLAAAMAKGVSEIKAQYAYPYWVAYLLNRCGLSTWAVPADVAEKALAWVREAGVVRMGLHTVACAVEFLRRQWCFRRHRHYTERWLREFLESIPPGKMEK